MPSTDHEGAVIGRTFADSTPAFLSPTGPRPGAPNVLYVLYDDLGWADFGCFWLRRSPPRRSTASPRRTALHELPRDAAVLPTRASLLTGRNHHATGMGLLPNFALEYPGHRGQLHHTTATIGEMAQAQGYTTLGVGSGHLTPMNQFTGAGLFDQWPLRRGFDRFYGTPDGMTNQWRPDLIEDNHWSTPRAAGLPLHRGHRRQGDRLRARPPQRRRREAVLPLRRLRPALPAPRGPRVRRQVRAGLREGLGRHPGGPVGPAEGAGPVPRTPSPAAQPRRARVGRVSPEDRAAMVRLQAAYAGMVEHTDEHPAAWWPRWRRWASSTTPGRAVQRQRRQPGGRRGRVDERDEVLLRLRVARRRSCASKENQDAIGWSPDFINTYAVGWSMAGNTRSSAGSRGHPRRRRPLPAGGPLPRRDPRPRRHPHAVPPRHRHHADRARRHRHDRPSQVGGVEQEPLHGESLRYTFAQPEAPRCGPCSTSR